MSLKIGIVQLAVIEGDGAGNCAKIEKWVRTCVGQGIDILCFPELCISGYKFETAVSLNEAEFMAGLAKKYGQALLAGIHMVHGEKHYNSACLWDETGRLLKEYQKIHLWAKENDFFERGKELASVDYRGWKIGMLMCADLGFAEISMPLSLKEKIDIIICPSAWGYGSEELYSGCVKIRAAENQVFVVALNRACGNEKYCGNSTAANPDGTVLCRLTTVEEAFAVVTFEKEKLDQAREFIPWRQMKQDKIYAQIMKRYE